MATRGSRGAGKDHFALWEELPYARVEPTGKPVAIYKRLDAQTHLPLEERNYYAHFPIRGTRGKRKSLLVSSRVEAEIRAQEELLNIRVQLAQGVTLAKTTVETVVEKFLRDKQTRIRGAWEGKQEAGRRSITAERYELVAGKLRNYLLPFLGAKTDAQTVPDSKWKQWEAWRRENDVKGGKPKADTLLNEMGVIKECWKWSMEAGLIPFSPRLPFHGENLATNDRVRRDTWDPHEWNSFKGMLPKWLRSQMGKGEDHYWDCFVSYQMLFFLANNGMRTGELVKVKRKDIDFYKYEKGEGWLKNHLCALVQVHSSTKTGSRVVNSMGGVFARRVWEKSQHKRSTDFLFCHLDGSPFTTKQFWKKFQLMTAYTNEDDRWQKHLVPYSLRHLYATSRLQNGTSKEALCRNMGVTETYLRKHYDHYLTRLATADLTRMRKDIGLGGTILREGDDFVLMDESA